MYRRAYFSECRKWRYALYIVWDSRQPLLHCCMLNPSTADEFKNDPTVERQCRRAAMMGCGGLIVTNAYAWRDTYPEGLYVTPDPIGKFNDVFITRAAREAKVTICGWGHHCDKVARKLALPARSTHITTMLRGVGASPVALGFTKDKSPRHPLYCRYEAELLPMP